jgi:AcrR family transcriptional regulator
MVQKHKKARGRPRAYDPATALSEAQDAFWELGYSATSLDRLSDATDMNRPSMYAAFGDKHALYLKTLQTYIAESERKIELVLSGNDPLAHALKTLYDAALALYLPPGSAARGCYLIGTAATEAATDDDIRAILLRGLRSFDRAIRARIERARDEGELPASTDTDSVSILASAVLHTLAVRSRAGESKTALKAIVSKSVATLCEGVSVAELAKK